MVQIADRSPVPTRKPTLATVLDEKTVADVKALCEAEDRTVSQMLAILIREAIKRRKRDGVFPRKPANPADN